LVRDQTVPRLEKMLYVNGQIIEFLTNLWTARQETMPLIVCLIGFTVIQLVVAGSDLWISNRFVLPRMGQSFPQFRSVDLVGMVFLATQLVTIIFPT
jgi:hypothetical protein